MKLGADPKRVAILVGLTGAAAYLLYTNVFSSPSTGPARTASRPLAVNAPPEPGAALQNAALRTAAAPASGRRNAQDFRPVWKSKVAPNLSDIDPKLRLDLLAKVQAVEAAPAERNLFKIGPAALPGLRGGKEPIIPPKPVPVPEASKPNPSAPPGPPPPPPITLKYYGYIAQRANGHKRAFFLDGDDILVAGEGDLMKRRYKVVRIGVNSVVVEDTDFNSTQELRLAEEAAG